MSSLSFHWRGEKFSGHAANLRELFFRDVVPRPADTHYLGDADLRKWRAAYGEIFSVFLDLRQFKKMWRSATQNFTLPVQPTTVAADPGFDRALQSQQQAVAVADVDRFRGDGNAAQWNKIHLLSLAQHPDAPDERPPYKRRRRRYSTLGVQLATLGEAAVPVDAALTAARRSILDDELHLFRLIERELLCARITDPFNGTVELYLHCDDVRAGGKIQVHLRAHTDFGARTDFGVINAISIFRSASLRGCCRRPDCMTTLS